MCIRDRRECSGRGRLERLVERTDCVGVEVVHHHQHSLGVWVVDGEQVLHLVGPVHPRALSPGHDPAPAGQRFDPHEDRARPVAHVLGVLLAVMTRRGGDRVTGMAQELVGLLVHAHHRQRRIPGPGVDVQDVLHPRHELPVGLGRDGPALLQMRTKRPLLSVFPMVEWSRSGMSSINATCRSSSRSDQRACPSGGVEQARAINLASTSPVTFGSTGGVSRFLRRIVASTSPPRSAKALEVFTTVSTCTPARSATTAWVGTGPSRPESFSSNSNKIRARRTCWAGFDPVRTSLTNISRSAVLNATGCDFDLAITDSILTDTKGKAPARNRHSPTRPSISGDTLLAQHRTGQTVTTSAPRAMAPRGGGGPLPLTEASG